MVRLLFRFGFASVPVLALKMSVYDTIKYMRGKSECTSLFLLSREFLIFVLWICCEFSIFRF